MFASRLWVWYAGVLLLPCNWAFPTGPGSCDPGVPVQGDHVLFEQVGGGPLSDKGFEVTLRDQPLQAGVERNVPIDEDLELTLSATLNDTFFRGFLIRIEGEDDVDTTDFLRIPDGALDIQVLSLCVNLEKVGGVAHVNNDNKTETTSLMRLVANAGNLTMDVTVVVENRNGRSEWYNSRYLLNAVQAVEGPTVAPASVAIRTPSPTESSVSPLPTVMSPTVAVPPTALPTTVETEAPSVLPGEVSPTAPQASSSGVSRTFSAISLCLVVAVAIWSI